MAHTFMDGHLTDLGRIDADAWDGVADDALPCALIWQQDSEYAKALAVALICMTLFQLVTVRAIHLPLGLAGWFAVALTAGIGNTYYWIEAGNSLGLALSTLGLVSGIIYTLGAMRSNHHLHAELGRRSIAADAASPSCDDSHDAMPGVPPGAAAPQADDSPPAAPA